MHLPFNSGNLDSTETEQEWITMPMTMVSRPSSKPAGRASTPGDADQRSNNNGLAAHHCTHPGCGKKFTRAEHLQRHVLNHAPGGLACSLCSANFKRPDLLKRHMDRHRQKDLEAGGPGFGVLDTRKRAWRAPDGSIVDKRPCRDQTKKPTSKNRHRPRLQEPSPDSEPLLDTTPRPVSAARSLSEDGAHDGAQVTLRLSTSHLPEQYSSVPGDLSDDFVSCVSPSSYNSSLSFANPTQQLDATGVFDDFWTGQYQPAVPDPNFYNDYEQIFQPDTASSFNMPFTTALDYNWLFNTKSPPKEPIQTVQGIEPGDRAIDSLEQRQQQDGFYALSPESMSRSIPYSDASVESRHHPLDTDMHPRIVSQGHLGPRSTQSFTPPDSRSNTSSGIRIDAARTGSGRRSANYQSIPPELERPFSTISGSPTLPKISGTVRDTLLSIVEAANPCLPDQRVSLWEDPNLATGALQTYLDLYFTRFNTTYPLIHLATFNPENTEPLLTLSLLLLGATYSNKEAHQLAVCIHDVIRPSIFAHAGFSPQPQLWTLQTILLVECFGKSRAGQKQHDMSHLFHGLLINLIRRSDCQSIKPQGPSPQPVDNEALKTTWEKWAIAEQKKRLALLCFMWDTQHAVLFCQSLCMSAFELRLEMPCTQSIWEAPDAASWSSTWRSTTSNSHKISFLAALKSYLAPSFQRPTSLSSLSRVLILHGIMATYWDMNRRDQTSLGVIEGGNGEFGWRKLVSSAYDLWKSDFEAYCAAVSLQYQNGQALTTQNDSYMAEMSSFAAAYKALYHSAQIILNMDFLDVQIYAGARNILGRPVQQRDYLHSAEVVKKWAASEGKAVDASQENSPLSDEQPPAMKVEQRPEVAAWHAASMLHHDMDSLVDSDAMGLFHVPWCLYIVTLTCWAYHHARPLRTSALDVDEADEIIWDPRGEMQLLVAEMTEQPGQSQFKGKRRTSGLVWTMAEVLTKVRWGIVHAGVVVLRGLVPQRLINQYEDPTEWGISGR